METPTYVVCKKDDGLYYLISEATGLPMSNGMHQPYRYHLGSYAFDYAVYLGVKARYPQYACGHQIEGPWIGGDSDYVCGNCHVARFITP